MAVRTRKFAGLVLAVGITVGALAGCTAGDSGDEPAVARSDAAGASEMDPRPGMAADQGTDGSGKAERPPASLTQLANSDRKLARSANLSLRTDDVPGSAAKVRAIAQRAGGYVGSEVAGEKSATLSITVPSDELDAVLDQIADAGKLVQREVQVRDVTEEIVDVDSRVASQRASVARVRALLSRAQTISEIVSIESELTARESELEALRARQESLKGMVAMSTVTVSIAEGDAVEDEEPTGFVAGLISGWNAFLDASGVVLTAVGAALPFLIALGVPVALLVWWLRRRGRPARQTEATTGPAAPAAPNSGA